MLEYIRKSTKSTYILLLFGAIILVFVFWGVDPGGRGRSANAVAVVNGEPIDMSEYLALHKRLTDYYRNVLKDKYTPSVEKGLNLKQNAVSILIDRSLAVMEAGEKGMKVSEVEVQDTIAAMEAFQKDGVFDKDRYFSTLNSERMKPADFEDDVRRDILVERVRASVIEGVTVNDDDVQKAFLREKREIDLTYAYVDVSDKRAEIKVSDKEGKQYLIDHSTDFVLPAKLKVVYASADYSDFKKRTSISEAEIKEYYEKNQDQYMDPEKIQARHILIRPDVKNKDRAAAKKDAVEKARGILAKIEAGEGFEALARKHSADPGSAKKGGDLGWFPRGVMMKSFEDAAFALKPGEVSGVVESPFGAHIIRLEGRKTARLRPLVKVRASIKAALSKDLSNERAMMAIKALEEPFKNTKNVKGLKQAVEAAGGMTFHETALFDARHFDESLAKVGRIKDSLFLMSEGEVSEPVVAFSGLYLVKVIKRVDARIPEYDEVKDDVKDTLAASKALRSAKKEAGELLKAVKGGKKLKDAAVEMGLKQGETGFFALGAGYIPGIGAPVQAHVALFDLNSAKPVYGKNIAESGKFFVVEWRASKEADLSELTPDVREALTEMLQSTKEEQKISEWLGSLRKTADIKVFEDRL